MEVQLVILFPMHSLSTFGMSAGNSQRIRVKMANGSIAFCTEILPDVEVAIANYRGLHNLVVMPVIDGYDVVLGTPFLTSAGASIHYRTSTITWDTNSHSDSVNTSNIAS